MSHPVETVGERTLLDDARRLMEEHRIRHLPVVGPDGELRGIVSERDLARAEALDRATRGERPTLRIGDVMQHEVVTIDERRPASEAARAMVQQKVGALPVVDDAHHLVGIITSSDFLALAARTLAHRPPR
jgi:CBS domain-containing protein